MVPDVDYDREIRSKARAMLIFFLGPSQISIWLSLAHVTQKLVWCAHREARGSLAAANAAMLA
jgi:hypothetical protein